LRWGWRSLQSGEACAFVLAQERKPMNPMRASSERPPHGKCVLAAAGPQGAFFSLT